MPFRRPLSGKAVLCRRDTNGQGTGYSRPGRLRASTRRCSLPPDRSRTPPWVISLSTGSRTPSQASSPVSGLRTPLESSPHCGWVVHHGLPPLCKAALHHGALLLPLWMGHHGPIQMHKEVVQCELPPAHGVDYHSPSPAGPTGETPLWCGPKTRL